MTSCSRAPAARAVAALLVASFCVRGVHADLHHDGHDDVEVIETDAIEASSRRGSDHNQRFFLPKKYVKVIGNTVYSRTIGNCTIGNCNNAGTETTLRTKCICKSAQNLDTGVLNLRCRGKGRGETFCTKRKTALTVADTFTPVEPYGSVCSDFYRNASGAVVGKPLDQAVTQDFVNTITLKYPKFANPTNQRYKFEFTCSFFEEPGVPSIVDLMESIPSTAAIVDALTFLERPFGINPLPTWTAFAPVNDVFCAVGAFLGISECLASASCTSDCWNPTFTTIGVFGVEAILAFHSAIPEAFSTERLGTEIPVPTFAITDNITGVPDGIQLCIQPVAGPTLALAPAFGAPGSTAPILDEPLTARNGLLYLIGGLLDPEIAQPCPPTKKSKEEKKKEKKKLKKKKKKQKQKQKQKAQEKKNYAESTPRELTTP